MGGFIVELREYRHILSKQTVKTLKGQYLSGNAAGARKGLETALRNLSPMVGAHRNAKVYNDVYGVDYTTQRDLCLSVIFEIKKGEKYVKR